MFITIEGIDGSGKSTFCKLLKNELSKRKKVFLTKEPTIHLNLRKIILNYKLSDLTMFYLLCADRTYHFDNYIKPNLDENNIVICDRFIDSTFVYQGYIGKIDLSFIENNINSTIKNTFPNITFYLRIDPEIAYKRVSKRKSDNSFDNKSIEWYKLLSESYDKHFNNIKHQRNIILIDANQTPQQILDKALFYLKHI